MVSDRIALDQASVTAWATFGVEPSDSHSFRRQLADGSFAELIGAKSLGHAGRLALRIGDDSLTYSELELATARAASWLEGNGIHPGTRVMVCGANSVELITVWLAVARLGAVSVITDPTLKARELNFLMVNSDCRAVLADEDVLERIGTLDSIKTLSLVQLLRAGSGPGIRDVSRNEPPRPATALPPGTLCTLQYTSGTTGQPKGAMLTHGNLLASLRSAIIAWRWSDEDVLVHSLPMSHGHGLNGVLTALLVGATAVVLPRTDAELICRTVDETEATILYSVPAIWERILAWEDFDARYFRSLRLFTSGSAPLSPRLSDRVKEALGERPLERYGATEAGFVTTNPIDGPRIPGMVGKPFPGVEVRIAGPEGQSLPRGRDGEIVVRGPAVFSGYWRLDGSEHFFPDGWFRTGDVGRFDAINGYLAITGRLKDMIISGGLNVYPREVELIAEEFSGVKEAVATGIPSTVWGEEVVLAVVTEDVDLDVQALTAHLKRNLAGYKVPKQVKRISAVPRNQMGKALRSELSRQWSDVT